MSKDGSAFRTIGELSKELNIKPHILRYWEDQFAMLQPLKRAGARRHYRPEDVEMVRTINRLVNEEGYTIKGARKALTQRQREHSAPADAPANMHGASVADVQGRDQFIAELKNIRSKLYQALENA